MNGEERRTQLIDILSKSDAPVSGTVLARKLQVTRQAIVQDVALLKANGQQIFSTSRGYVLMGNNECERIFKTIHSDDDVEQELTLIIDLGGKDMNIKSRKDIAEFMQNINTGKSKPLKNVTSGYHYHTVIADDVQTLNEIESCLRERGFLAKLNEYEPVDFRKNEK